MSACPVASWCDDGRHASPDEGWRTHAVDQVVRRHASAGTHISYISPDTGLLHALGVAVVCEEISNGDTIGTTAPRIEILGSLATLRLPPNDALALAEAIWGEVEALERVRA
jgi:hypothetical protein